LNPPKLRPETITALLGNETGEIGEARVSVEGVVKINAALQLAEELVQRPFAERVDLPGETAQPGVTYRRGALLFSRNSGIQSAASRQACSILEAGFCDTAQAGLRRFMDHRSGCAPQEIPQSIRRDQPPSGDKHGPKLAFADQDVKRTAR
jgi:hypothetical protein